MVVVLHRVAAGFKSSRCKARSAGFHSVAYNYISALDDFVLVLMYRISLYCFLALVVLLMSSLTTRYGKCLLDLRTCLASKAISTTARTSPTLSRHYHQQAPTLTSQRASTTSQPILRSQYFSSTSSHAEPSMQHVRSTSSADSTASRKHDFTYEIAASFCSKQNKFDPMSNYYTFPSTSHKILLSGQTPWTPASGRFESGQDALYTSVLGDDGLSFGLADGVGGWADQGIDPSDFSHGLCDRMAEASEAFGKNRTKAPQGNSLPKDLPRRILQEAFDGISDDDSVQGGGSTACVGVVDWAGKMTTAKYVKIVS